MRYIDAFCHFSPKRYFDALVESPSGQKDIGKRVRGIPALYDLDLRLKVVDQFPDYTQVLSLGLPMVDRLWGPDQTPEMSKLANDGLAEVCAKHPDRFTGLVVAIGVPLSLVAVSLPSRAITARSTAQQEAIGAAGRSASDLMQGIGVLKSLGGERWALGRYRTLSRDAATAGIATGSRSGLLEGIGALTMMGVLAAVILTAGLRVTSGDMGIGTFVAVLGVAAFFTEPMQALAQIIGRFSRSRGAAARIAGYLGETASSGATGDEPSTASMDVEVSATRGLRVTLPPLDDAGPLDTQVLELLAIEITEHVGRVFRYELALAEHGDGTASRAEALGTQTKSTDVDPVTRIDTESEALIRRILAELRPQDAILGEEEGGRIAESGVTWIADPVFWLARAVRSRWETTRS